MLKNVVELSLTISLSRAMTHVSHWARGSNWDAASDQRRDFEHWLETHNRLFKLWLDIEFYPFRLNVFWARVWIVWYLDWLHFWNEFGYWTLRLL